MNEILEKWKEKLLDLGSGNRLLNFKDSKLVNAEAVGPDIDKLYELLSNGNKLDAYVPNMVRKDFEELNFDPETITRNEYIHEFKKKIKKNELLLYSAFRIPLEKIIENLWKKSSESIIERGINILYMAFGFLSWTDIEKNNFISPIILLPLKINFESILKPYSFEIFEDDIIINPTLVYKLKRDFNINLPEIDDEQIPTAYLDSLKGILNPEWSINYIAKIGLFSFYKMNMYLDIKDNEEKILKNNNVRALMGLSPLVEDNSLYSKTYSLSNQQNSIKTDDKIKTETINEININDYKLHNVIDADSSQIEAVIQAKNGKSFVLQGPPGTGKSQTITNIIAECLYDNKKVLFVSEKLAALNVVYNNLKKVSLEDFCLELHSQKTNKKEVINELNRVLKLEKISLSNKANDELEALDGIKDKLDGYAEILHTKYKNVNLSPYELFSEISTLETFEDVDFKIENIEEKGEDYFKNAVELSKNYLDYNDTIGYDWRENCWNCFKDIINPDDFKQKFINSATATVKTISGFQSSLQELENYFDISNLSYDKLIVLLKALNFFGNIRYFSNKLFDRECLKNNIRVIENLRDSSVKILEIKCKIDVYFNADFYKLDGAGYYKKFLTEYSGFRKLFKKQYKSDRNMILSCKKEKKISDKDIIGYLLLLKNMQHIMGREYNENCAIAKELLGDNYKGIYTKWDDVLKEYGELKNWIDARILTDYFKTADISGFRKNQLLFRNKAESVFNVLKENKPSYDYLLNCFEKGEFDFNNTPFDSVAEKLNECSGSIDTLENWLRFDKVLDKIKAVKLDGFLIKTIEKNIAVSDIVSVFRKIYYRQWILHIFGKVEILKDFSRVSQDNLVKIFGEKDKLQFEISKAQIKTKLSGQKPDIENMIQGSEVAVLLREGEKKRMQMPVRVLLSRISALAQLLKPCFLMSPLSVSTFLDSNSLNFDVAIFDEASQIFPEDSLGAIYRAKQVIIVGDSKQMPPSNFFNAGLADGTFNEDDFSEDVNNYESILDISSVTFSQKRLKWHYRSRIEDLISFSNNNFYSGELVTFPQALKKTKDFGVDFYYVNDGFFNRSSKVNIREANFISDLVFEHFKNYPGRSLGVVAFSVSQQEAIDDMLLKKREKDNSLEEFFSSEKKEPFFIKNLETVQGDERDTIIFSIAYAKDENGKFIHNFGPLNKVGGERRLNVAVSRAKYNVKVVSSIRANDIDTDRVSNEGAKLLRGYLDYAEKGVLNNVNKEKISNQDFIFAENADITDDICDFLKGKGYIIERNIGNSCYKIDIAVKQPQENRFILGIECDGGNFKAMKTTRDRERLRKEVLERLGWNYYRIWSTDWIKNNWTEREKLVRKIEESIGGSRQEIKKQEETVKKFINENGKISDYRYYEYADLPLLLAQYKKKRDFVSLINGILYKEAPVNEEFLLKRIIPVFEKEKITVNIRNEFSGKLDKIKDIVRKDGFIYQKDCSDFVLRIPKEGDEPRDVRYIAPEELNYGFTHLVEDNISISRENLIRATVKLLGFSRNAGTVNEILENTLINLIKTGALKEKDDIISLA